MRYPIHHWIEDRYYEWRMRRAKRLLQKMLKKYVYTHNEYYLISILWDILKERDYEDNDATRYANLDDQLVAVALQKGKFPINHPIMTTNHEKV